MRWRGRASGRATTPRPRAGHRATSRRAAPIRRCACCSPGRCISTTSSRAPRRRRGQSSTPTRKPGVTPALDRLQLLASCYIKLNDSAGYVFALEKYLVYYPKKEYWADAIRRVETRRGLRGAPDARRVPAAAGHRQSHERRGLHGDGAARAQRGLSGRGEASPRTRLRSGRIGHRCRRRQSAPAARPRDQAGGGGREDARAERQGRRRGERRSAARQRRLRHGDRRAVRQGPGAHGAGNPEGRHQAARRREPASRDRLSRRRPEGKGDPGVQDRAGRRRHRAILRASG